MVELGRAPRLVRAALCGMALPVTLVATGCTVDGDECIADCALDGRSATGVAFVQDTERGPNRTEELTVSAHSTACFELCATAGSTGTASSGSRATLSCKDRCLRQSTVEIRCQRAARPWVPHLWAGH